MLCGLKFGVGFRQPPAKANMASAVDVSVRRMGAFLSALANYTGCDFEKFIAVETGRRF